MFDRLEDILIRLAEILNELNEPNVANDTARFQKLMKEQSDLHLLQMHIMNIKNVNRR